jgi:diaminopimelate decarboxylase
MKPEKRPWKKPLLSEHGGGFVNKFGAIRSSNFIDLVDGVPIADLVNQYGSPLFVLSERRLRENFRRHHRAFSTRYPKVIHAWSYKTNYLGAVCNILHQEGAWAEVVSDFEYEKARELGVPGKYILFNGPHKSRAILTRAVKEGAHIHLDHLDEIFMLEDIAKALNKKVPVTLRLHFNTGFTEPWSRFGFHLESGEAMEAARHIAKTGRLQITGLHSHIGTFILDPRAYAAQVRLLCQFMDEVEAERPLRGEMKTTIESIDIGGGFASLNALQGSYLPAEQISPNVEQYAEAICTTLMEATQKRKAQGRERPTLFIETGRALVDDTELLVTSVVGNKRLPDGRRAVILDAGVNLLFTSFWYNHEIRPTRPLDGIPEETILYGPMCMNIDVMRWSIKLPPVGVGERLIFWPVGAYNNTQWMQFIEYRPNVVMVGEDGSHVVIRAAENLEYMTHLESMPERLRDPFKKGSHKKRA